MPEGETGDSSEEPGNTPGGETETGTGETPDNSPAITGFTYTRPLW